LAQAADIGLDRQVNSGANLHPVTTLIAGMTSIGNDCIHRQTQDYKGCGQDAQTETLKRLKRGSFDGAVLNGDEDGSRECRPRERSNVRNRQRIKDRKLRRARCP
jgi:hypothetical protein